MGQAFEAARGRRNGHVHGALKSRANDVITDISELRKDVSKLAEAVGKVAKVEAASYTERLAHIPDEVRSRAEDSAIFVSDQVRARPVTAVGLSVGIGVLLGLAFAARD
jgi:ElaB/YqjD/DUF883 family membrane-anchored ribosome-binding protein